MRRLLFPMDPRCMRPITALSVSRPCHRGFSLLEILVSLIVLTLMLAVGVGYLSRRSDNLANQAVAQQMQRIGDAVDVYAQANLASKLTHDGLIQLSQGELSDMGNYLPLGVTTPVQEAANKNIIDIAMPNPLGIQTYYIEIEGFFKTKRIKILVYINGGLDVSKNALPIAQILGAGGFYVDNKDRSKSSGQSYWNSYGQLDNSVFNRFLLTPTSRDIGQVLYAPFATGLNLAGANSANWLCRDKNGMSPDCNKMATGADIDMNGQRILNVKEIHIQKGGEIVFDGTGKTILDEHGLTINNTIVLRDVYFPGASDVGGLSLGNGKTLSLMNNNKDFDMSVDDNGNVELSGRYKNLHLFDNGTQIQHQLIADRVQVNKVMRIPSEILNLSSGFTYTLNDPNFIKDSGCFSDDDMGKIFIGQTDEGTSGLKNFEIGIFTCNDYVAGRSAGHGWWKTANSKIVYPQGQTYWPN
jgi:prepilin-type N-terminal cleavage/methylation domain-containing protein